MAWWSGFTNKWKVGFIMSQEDVWGQVLDEQQKEVETKTQTDKESANQEMAGALAEAADYKDRWLRSQAEFQNYRKRQDRERVDMRAMAAAETIKQILPIVDDLDRAFRQVPADMRSNPWLDGFRLIERKFAQVLEQAGVSVIETVGKRFDPTFHESAADEESDQPHGTILEEYRKGYMLNDKVLRPAMVKIAR
jgi:molecular chaperone GrpE